MDKPVFFKYIAAGTAACAALVLAVFALHALPAGHMDIGADTAVSYEHDVTGPEGISTAAGATDDCVEVSSAGEAGLSGTDGSVFLADYSDGPELSDEAITLLSESGESVLTEGGSYYQYQWGLKNNGNIQRSSSSSSMDVRRSPGEMRRQPPGSGTDGASSGSGSGSSAGAPSGGASSGGSGSGGSGGAGGRPSGRGGSFGRFSEEESDSYAYGVGTDITPGDDNEPVNIEVEPVNDDDNEFVCTALSDGSIEPRCTDTGTADSAADTSGQSGSASAGFILSSGGLGLMSSGSTVVQAVEDIDINVEPAWEYYEQSSERRTVTVAIIDTGVDITHSELAGAIWVNTDEIAGDGIDNDGNGYIDDVNGWNFYSGNNQVYVGEEDDHGTHGAGTIAAAWDGTGTVGIADSTYVKIMPLKVFGADDSTGSLEGVKEAIRYAEANGADICNLSIGTYSYDEELEALMNSSSMLFVVSAGNGDTTGTGYDIDSYPMYPASFAGDNIISVANLMFDGSLSESSNYGTTGVDLAAPGTYILSTEPGGSYGFMSGTSMSAPMVTGIAALIYSCRTDMSIMDVRTAILSTTRTLSDLSGKILTGGIPDTYAAITYGL